ncbi:abortive infection family protein [Frankia tisae]|uniref:abortive infection family protein n=1 Tax=Frankia tisae TaxID=2950104 RepID=UPI0021BEEF2C|nr:abortive infection family protein [Frankia tisae]
MSAELIGSTTRGLFRALMTDSTVLEIRAAFQDEGFAPSPACAYEDSSARRVLTQAYLEAVDWTDLGHVTRALRAFERLVDGVPSDLGSRFRFLRSLRRDGYVLDEDSGHLVPLGPRLPETALSGLKDPSAIREHLDRIQRAAGDDPALAIGSAKELIESTAKVVLVERGLSVDDKADMPALIGQAQKALGLHRSTATPGPDGSDPVKKILGSVTGIAVGVNELRNRAGTGHGPTATRGGLGARHAHLAVNAALTWCQLILDTLADPDAPWHKNP